MKKFLILMLCMMFSSAAFASSVQMKVTAIEDFNTQNPSAHIKVKVNNDIQLGNYNIKSGDVLENQVLNVTEPKRGKRNACFYVKPLYYVSEGSAVDMKEEFYGKYSKTILSKEELKKIPPGKVVKKAALTVGSHFVKGLSTGVAFAKGVVNNEEDNRLKSGVVEAYKESPLSYAGKGEELDIKSGDEFYFVFNTEAESASVEDKPNYSYTESAE